MLGGGAYVVRCHGKGAEFVKPDGTWRPHPDMWDIATKGRYLCDDGEEAMKEAREFFGPLREYGFEYR